MTFSQGTRVVYSRYMRQYAPVTACIIVLQVVIVLLEVAVDFQKINKQCKMAMCHSK